MFLRNPATVEPAAIRVAMTPERIARGKYIFTLADCDGCHSPRDWSRFAGPIVESERGQGVEFPRELGLGRAIASANITSDPQTGIGAWSDGLKIRAIREGIGRDGRALNEWMPYRRFRHMSDEDVLSLVAYLNTLVPVKHEVRRSKPLFTAYLWKRARPSESVPEPSRGNVREYGRYLATLGGCRGCHTASRTTIGRVSYGGGRRFHLAGGTVVSPNITPDPYTGIGRWSDADWLGRVYQYREYVERGSPKVGPENLTVMPWLGLTQVEPDDLKAIFAYLRTQKPVYRPIVLHPQE